MPVSYDCWELDSYLSGCGDRTRTCDLRVMSPTSYQLLYSAISHFVVPVTGLEPVQYRYRGILSPLCLPIPPHRQLSATIRISYGRWNVKPRFKKSKKLLIPGRGVALFRAISRHRAHILTKDRFAKEEIPMKTLYVGSDVDDLIFQDNWLVSDR